MSANGTPPIEWPRISVAGVEYVLRFSCGAIYRLESMGIDATNPQGTNQPMHQLFAMLACTLGREENGRWQTIQLKPEEIADAIPPEDLPRINAAIQEARIKVPQVETPAIPPASSEPETAVISG